MKSRTSDGGSRIATRCISDNLQCFDENNLISRNTTRSWPFICRQSKHYKLEKDEEHINYETIFIHNNEETTGTNTTNSDDLLIRKYSVADPKP